MEYVTKITKILTDVKGWMLLVVGLLTAVRVVKEGIAYQQGDGSIKRQCIENIKHSIYMGGGIFLLVWFAGYVASVMK